MKYRGRMVLLFMSLLTSFIFWTVSGELSPLFIIYSLLHAAVSWFFGGLYDKHKYLSFHDPLTGVFNRRYAYSVVEKKLRRADKREQSVGVISMDIDQFKTINDTFGHDYGDFILKEITELVERNIHKEDIFIRWGGDEFLLLLANRDFEEMEKFIKNLNDAIHNVCSQHSEGQAPLVSLSIGFSVYPEDATKLPQLITIADERMYQVKHGTKSS